MKKTILYLLAASIVTVSNGVATEVSEIEMLRAMNLSLREQIEKVEMKATIELSLKAEEIAHLKESIENIAQENNLALSPYQQWLLPQWEQGKIGDRAWAALDGRNPRLAAVLLNRIQAYPGKIVEIFYLGTNNFKLRINGKEKNYPYKF